MSSLHQIINFTRGVPANDSFPIREVIEAANAVLESHGTAMLQYGPALGFGPLREWLAEWQRVPVDRVLTGNGSLQLIEFLCLQQLARIIAAAFLWQTEQRKNIAPSLRPGVSQQVRRNRAVGRHEL